MLCTTDWLDPIDHSGEHRWTRSWAEPTVELRLGKIGPRLAQDLVGLVPIADLALQSLGPLLLLARQATMQPLIPLRLAPPMPNRLRPGSIIKPANLTGERDDVANPTPRGGT